MSLPPTPVPPSTSDNASSPPVINPDILGNIIAHVERLCLPALMATSHTALDLAAPRLYSNITVDLNEPRNAFNGVNFHIPLKSRSRASHWKNSKRYVLKNNAESMYIVPHTLVDHSTPAAKRESYESVRSDFVTSDIELPKLMVIRSRQLVFCRSPHDYLGRPLCGSTCPLLACATPSTFVHEPLEDRDPWYPNPAQTAHDKPRRRVVPLPRSVKTVIHILRPAHLCRGLYAYIDYLELLFPGDYWPHINFVFLRESAGWEPATSKHGQTIAPWEFMRQLYYRLLRSKARNVTFIGIESLDQYLPPAVRLAQDRMAAMRDEAAQWHARWRVYELDPALDAARSESFACISLEDWVKDHLRPEWGLQGKAAEWIKEHRERGTA